MISIENYYFQRSQVLGNKIEMEITSLIEKNPTILRLGLHLEYNDARHRIATHLQRNIDTSKSLRPITVYIFCPCAIISNIIIGIA